MGPNNSQVKSKSKSAITSRVCDVDRATSQFRRALEAHLRHDFAEHLAAKRELIGMGVGITFRAASGWEEIQ